MRAIIAALAIITSVTGATSAVAGELKAEGAKPIRVIEITRENAEASAALIAAAKSPLIGMPPQGRVVREASAETAPPTARDKLRNARAELVAPELVSRAPAIEQAQLRPRVTRSSYARRYVADSSLAP